MKDISNKTIVAMLAMAVVITVLGTFISINKLSLTNDLGFSFLTGAATSSTTGVTNLTITSQTSITNQVNSIEFGSGKCQIMNSLRN